MISRYYSRKNSCYTRRVLRRVQSFSITFSRPGWGIFEMKDAYNFYKRESHERKCESLKVGRMIVVVAWVKVWSFGRGGYM